MLSCIGKGGGNLLITIPLVVLLPFGALLMSGCSANEAVEDTSEEPTTATGTLAVWNYVALGDSLVAGTGASYEGYVNRYAGYLKADTGIQAKVINLGQNGLTSPELLDALRNDPSWRRAVGGDDVQPLTSASTTWDARLKSTKTGPSSAPPITRTACVRWWQRLRVTGTRYLTNC